MFTCRVLGALIWAITLSACGIGGGVQAFHTSLPTDDGDSVDIVAKSITVWDATGILLGAVGTAGNRYTAQKAAEEQAIRDGKKAGDSYEFEFDVIPPAPGNWTVFTYSWGNGTGSHDQDVEFWEFDMRTQLGNWRVGPVGLSVQLGAVFAKYKNFATDSIGGYDDMNVICMPTGMVGAMKVTPKGTLTGRAVLDPFISGLLYALDNDGWQMYELGARMDYRVLKPLNLYVDVARRRSALDGHIDETIASLGVGYIWGEKHIKTLKGAR